MGSVIVLLLLTWWAKGAADAAQPLMRATLVAPLPPAAWSARLVLSDSMRESGFIAFVGSGLIAAAAFVRRTTSPGGR